MFDFAGSFALPSDPASTQPDQQTLPDSQDDPRPPLPLAPCMPNSGVFAFPNPSRAAAVDRCLEASRRTLEDGYRFGQSRKLLLEFMRAGYFNAMPSPHGEEETLDFIACVTHGILSNLIEPEIATRLLYAAQIALTAKRRSPTQTKSKAKTPEPETPNPEQSTANHELEAAN